MIRLEDFPKEVLIDVIKQKFFNRKKEFFFECLQRKYMMDFTQTQNKCEKLINENTSLGTSVNDRKMYERQNEELRNMKDDEKWQ